MAKQAVVPNLPIRESAIYKESIIRILFKRKSNNHVMFVSGVPTWSQGRLPEQPAAMQDTPARIWQTLRIFLRPQTSMK